MPELIDRFNRVAQPFLEVFAPSTCIEQSRILVEVLPEFGVKVEAIETTMMVEWPSLKWAFIAGADAEERACGKRTAAKWMDRTTPAAEGYGHVAVAAEINGQPYLLEPTLAQASMPEQGLIIPRRLLAVGPLSELPAPYTQIDAGFAMDDGKDIVARWLVKDTRNFERTPAWEPSHLWPLIRRIVREMKWAAIVEARRRAG